jgi:alkylation response protein AidB-like acyl-CoA dehydrogenase
MSRLLIAALLAAPVPAIAQDGEAAAPPQRVRSVLLYGDDQCPKAESPDEIVVCANGGDSPYRIPKNLRERPVTPASTSWVRRAEVVDEVNRVTVPGSCTPVGTFGQSGCTLQSIQRWAAEKKAQKERDAAIP